MKLAFFVEEYPDSLVPLSLTTPVFELRYGRRQLIKMLSETLGEPDALIVPPRFKDYVEERYPGKKTRLSDLDGNVVLLNAAVRPGAAARMLELVRGGEEVLVDGGRLVAARVNASKIREEDVLLGRWAGKEVDALIKGPWELIEALTSWPKGSGVVYGSNVRIEEPVVIFSERGPVLIADDVKIEAFTRIEGPAYIGRGTIIHSARINAYTYIGEVCRVGGEVEHSIIAGYSNKAHEGYLGHSYVGSWVNIGAGAITSDLKNTYGPVKVGGRNTGLIKLGAFIGDYVKVSINASMYAGRRIGASSHVYGVVHEDIPPFVVYSPSQPPGLEELRLEKAVEIAERMMSRRGVSLSRGQRKVLEESFMLTLKERRGFLEAHGKLERVQG